MKKHLSWIVALVALGAVAATWRAPRPVDGFDVAGFGGLPVQVNGRVKPLDTVARTTLLVLQGRQRVVAEDGRALTPEEWLLDVAFRSHAASHYRVFAILHPELLTLLGLSPENGDGGKRFSLQQFVGRLADLDRQAKLADAAERAERTSFQRAVVQLRDGVALYQRLQGSFAAFGEESFLDRAARAEAWLEKVPGAETSPPAAAAGAEERAELRRMATTMDAFSHLRPIPPARGAARTEWRTVGAAWADSLDRRTPDPATRTFAALGRAWRDRRAEDFNAALQTYRVQLRTDAGGEMTRGAVEVRFNHAQPFYVSALLYVIGFLLGVGSWLKWPDGLRRAAFALVAVAFGLTTFGIVTRMWLEARPPVTNLYSSALFVGWGAVALCVLLERWYRNAIGSVTAGLIGFATLLIAHHLALGGDTMEMMRAVLDSNFWLATHVVTIAVGYSATFLAGMLAVIYVLRGVFTRSLDEATGAALGRMIYGVVCFATFFSFVGTILGGIWADQSWGRFWGWDPKENGALLIVIWNSLLLHARWAGLVQARGLACLAVFGNIVTAWSWFGVNMLGVGLHSYGFMDAAAWWLAAFVISQLAVMAAAAWPWRKWRSVTDGRLAARAA